MSNVSIGDSSLLEDRMMLRKKNIYRLWAFTPHLRGRLISLLLAVFLYLLETAEVLAWCLRCFIAGFLFTVWAYLVCVLFADTSVHANDLPQNHLDIANVWLWQPYIQSCNSIMQVICHTTILKKIFTSIFILRMLFLVVRSLFWLNVCVVIGNFSGWSIIRRQGSILPHRTSVPWLLLTERSWARASLRGCFCCICCFTQLLMGFNCFVNCMVVMILYGLWIAGLHCFVCALGCTVLCLLLILSRRFLLLGIEFDACTKLAKEYYSWYDRRKPCTVTSSVFPVLQTILVPVCIFSC